MKKSVIITGTLAILVLGSGILLYNMRDDIGVQVDNTQIIDNNAKQSLIDSIPKSSIEKNLDEYTGDEFDRYYIANMLAHHQGAVDMANYALTNAKHQELKTLAQEIISSQTKEIDSMESWQKQWNYPLSSGDMMVDHSAMGMMDEMHSMNSELQSLSGEAFDKKFIELMIEHHKSAISMSRPGAKNASHQEVKDLTVAVIDAQSKEIIQMQRWQKDWGY